LIYKSSNRASRSTIRPFLKFDNPPVREDGRIIFLLRFSSQGDMDLSEPSLRKAKESVLVVLDTELMLALLPILLSYLNNTLHGLRKDERPRSVPLRYVGYVSPFYAVSAMLILTR
jgi:hypothetical protein